MGFLFGSKDKKEKELKRLGEIAEGVEVEDGMLPGINDEQVSLKDIFPTGAMSYSIRLSATKNKVSDLFQGFYEIYDELEGANEGLEAVLAEAMEERVVLNNIIEMLEDELRMNKALATNLEQFIKPDVKQKSKGPQEGTNKPDEAVG